MKRAGLAATIKARWICEQAHQQLKEKLGLDHFEGRSWQGLHRHALMTMIAYAFLQHRHLTQVGRKKASTDRRLRLACRPYATPSPIILRPLSQQCPHCRRRNREKQWRGKTSQSMFRPYKQGTHSLLKFASQSSRGERRVRHVGARAIQRFWYGWKMWSFAFTAT